jgi:hypothetical protein
MKKKHIINTNECIIKRSKHKVTGQQQQALFEAKARFIVSELLELLLFFCSFAFIQLTSNNLRFRKDFKIPFSGMERKNNMDVFLAVKEYGKGERKVMQKMRV